VTWRRVDAYHWRNDDGYSICRVCVGGRWMFEAWPPRVEKWPTLAALPRALCHVQSFAEAAAIVDRALSAGPS
jgi:hypothetical protein